MTDASDVAERRGMLATRPNPASHLDYVVALEARIRAAAAATPVVVRLSYVPDRVIVEPHAFGAYVAAIGRGGWTALEQLGATILSDVNDALVPRWVQVVITEDSDGADGIDLHTVRLEDRQPNWDNESLLGRL